MGSGHAGDPARLAAALLAAAAIASIAAAAPAHAQSSGTDLYLEPVPSRAAAGDAIDLYGMLLDGDGHGVPGAAIYIKDDVDFGIDDTIAAVTTDEDGWFYVAWTAVPRSGGGAWDLYAVFDGYGGLRGSRSETHSVTVSGLASGPPQAPATPYPTILTLDAVPAAVYEGQAVVFTGYLESGGYAVEGAVVEIKEDDPLLPDDLLATARTGADGAFSVVWVAEQGMVETTLEVYAEYDGDGTYGASSTYRYEIEVVEMAAEPTSIALDAPPAAVYAGDEVVFTGVLTSGWYPVAGATVEIKEDDPLLPDDLLATARTDSDGAFSVVWVAEQGMVETTLEVYAEYDGDGTYGASDTARYEIEVVEMAAEPTSIVLDELPEFVHAGDEVVFTGVLTSGWYPVAGATVEIKEDDPLSLDDLLATARTDSDGSFSVVWVAEQGMVETTLEVYAEYDGDGTYGASDTARYEIEVVEMAAEPTSIALDAPPAAVYAGDEVVFTGVLTSGWYPVSGATVEIKEDDPLSPDQLLGRGTTDENGEFSVRWTASAGLVETDFDVYAEFGGEEGYGKSQTQRMEMSVHKIGGDIRLDPFPRTRVAGDMVLFTGSLELDTYSPEGARVYIMDEDLLNPDDLLAAAYVEADGTFAANWFASKVDLDSEADVYAVFEGNDRFHRQTTCDEGPTFSFGGLCGKTVPLSVQGAGGRGPGAGNGGGAEEVEDPYIDMYYSLDLDGQPHVAIAAGPDEPGEALRYIAPVQEGIMMWTSAMDGRYGGEWGVTFEIAEAGDPFYAERPDVVVNLVSHEEDDGCIGEYLGWAKVYRDGDPPRPVQTVVCTTSARQPVSSASAAETAAHEFIHAMGLGHAFNKRGDMMCSVEDGRPTCPGLGSEAGIPSDLNAGAVAEMYGADGFASPNRQVQYGDRFYGEGVVEAAGENQAARPGPDTAADGPPAGAGDGEASIPVWIKTSAGWWAEGSISDAEFASGMEYLVREGILPVPGAAAGSGGGGEGGTSIPQWVKASAGWWADGSISDAEFVRGIAHLMSAGIIRP